MSAVNGRPDPLADFLNELGTVVPPEGLDRRIGGNLPARGIAAARWLRPVVATAAAIALTVGVLEVQWGRFGLTSEATRGPSNPAGAPSATDSPSPGLGDMNSSEPPESIAPSATPAEPSVAPSSPTAFVVLLDNNGRQRVRVSIQDPNGVLRAARAATGAELTRVADTAVSDRVAVAPGRASGDVIVGWTGVPCDLTLTVLILDDQLTVAPGPQPACDAIGVARAVVLEFGSGHLPPSLKPRYVPGQIY